MEPAVASATGDETARLLTRSSFDSRKTKDRRSDPLRAAPAWSSFQAWKLATSSGIAISAPNFCAWLYARAIRAMPEIPVGKPR